MCPLQPQHLELRGQQRGVIICPADRELLSVLLHCGTCAWHVDQLLRASRYVEAANTIAALLRWVTSDC